MGQKLMTFVDGLEVEGRQDLRHDAEGADGLVLRRSASRPRTCRS